MRFSCCAFWLLTVLATTTPGPLASDDVDDDGPRKGSAKQVLGGESYLEVVREPDQLEVSLLKTAGPQPLKDFQTRLGPIKVGERVGRRLSKLLTTDSSYDKTYEGRYGCGAQYGLRLAFTRGEQRVDILFCLTCDDLVVFPDGEMGEFAPFGEIRDEILLIAQSLFPDDKALHSLKPHGSATED